MYKIGYKIVLTADRTLMSNYRRNIFFGFSACFPRGYVPDWFYFRFLCPSVPVGKDGEAVFAPYGLRKVEAALLEYGFDEGEVIVAHPDHLEKVIDSDTRVVGISIMDPLGKGPATSTFTNLYGGEAYMARKFRELIFNPTLRRFKPRIIVGGPGAWQLADGVTRTKFGIDTIVLGEAEGVVGPLFDRALGNGDLPPLVKDGNSQRFTKIVKPSICGLVEVARGCGRGCDFCSPTLQRFRSWGVDDIVEEVKVNLKAGLDDVIFHAEDVFRYGTNGISPNPEAVSKLFSTVYSLDGVQSITISHGTFASVLASPETIRGISEIMCLDENNWRAYETGIETGSPRLIKKHMKGKCKPFKPESWPDVIKQATAISNDNYWMPCATLILGLPGETDDDVAKTLELVDDLYHNYWIMTYPLFFVPLGILGEENFFTKDELLPGHLELFFRCWELNFKHIPKIFQDISGSLNYNPIEKRLVKIVLRLGLRRARRGIEGMRRKMEAGEPFRIGKNVFKVPPSRRVATVVGRQA